MTFVATEFKDFWEHYREHCQKSLTSQKNISESYYERHRQGSTTHSRDRGTVFSETKKLELKQCIIDLADIHLAIFKRL